MKIIYRIIKTDAAKNWENKLFKNSNIIGI